MAETAPTNLIALRDGRERAEALISQRFAEGLIDQDQLERRLERVHDAGTMTELEDLIVDLVEPGTSASAALVPLSPARASVALAHPDQIEDERRIVAVFASVEERGRWLPARRTRVIEVFGETELDFREAALGPGPTELRVTCIFAELDIIVPPELAVRVDAQAVIAEIDRNHEVLGTPASPDDPVLVITGLLMFAELDIHVRLPGESKREARKRRRSERRERRRERRALRRGR